MKPVFPAITLSSLRSGYGTGRPVAEVLDELVNRIAARGDDGVWIWRPDDAELRRMAAEICRNPATQPLFGVPFAVKDNIDVAGWPTTAGCPEFSHIASDDATVVARLKAAGAVPVGKTKLDQFATGLVGTRSPYGIPRCVFDDRFISGGSSSGSAVAVASGEVAFALGTDTAGSGRVPAAFNGLIGLKPTVGLISPAGVVPACRSLDCVSIFAHATADAATVLAATVGFDVSEPYSRKVAGRTLPSEGVRVGILAPGDREFFGDQEAARGYEEAVGQARATGWATTAIDFAPFAEMARELYAGPWVAERWAAVGDFLRAHPGAGDPVVRKIVEGAASRTAADAYRGVYQREAIRRRAEAVLDGVDVLLLPTVPTHYTVEEVLADPIGTNTRLGTYTNFVNLLDLCALAVPFGQRADGRPLGVTLMARAGADAALLHLGGCFLGEPPPPAAPADAIRLAVVGAHLRGQPLHGQLRDRGATFLQQTTTAGCYRLFALAHTTPAKPGLVRDESFAGQGLEVEVYALSADAFGSFTALVPPPLAIGNVQLADGSWVKGFVCEPGALQAAREITALGGWRTYVGPQAIRHAGTAG